MLRQRAHGLTLGYEESNDHDTLRDDPLVRTPGGRGRGSANPSTLCRLVRRAGHRRAIATVVAVRPEPWNPPEPRGGID